MTTSPNPDDPDTDGRTVPPYEGRRETADVDGPDKEATGGANTGGATGPVESDEDADPGRGGEGSPADEQPAEDAPESDADPEPGTTGAGHEPGTGRAEDKP
jgi:hypothetical protein